MANHASAGMFYAVIMGVLHFIVVDYVNRVTTQKYVQTKFPAGKGELGETPDQTLDREMGEELLVTTQTVSGLTQFRYVLGVSNDIGPGTYERHFMLINTADCDTCKLRREEMTERGGGTKLGIPYLMAAEYLMSDIYETHKGALARAIMFLTGRYGNNLGLSSDTISMAEEVANS